MGDAQLTVDVEVRGVDDLAIQLTIQLSDDEGNKRGGGGRTHGDSTIGRGGGSGGV